MKNHADMCARIPELIQVDNDIKNSVLNCSKIEVLVAKQSNLPRNTHCVRAVALFLNVANAGACIKTSLLTKNLLVRTLVFLSFWFRVLLYSLVDSLVLVG